MIPVALDPAYHRIERLVGIRWIKRNGFQLAADHELGILAGNQEAAGIGNVSHSE